MGCGRKPMKDYVNLDWLDYPWVDVKHDLNKIPYPFKDSQFDEIYCSQTLEHLNDTLRVLEEMWRITKKGGIIVIKVPHFSIHNALSDLSHKKVFSYESFDIFEREEDITPNFGMARFKILEKKVNFSVTNKLRHFNFIVNFIINKVLIWKYNLYERIFCYMLPSDELIFKLIVVK